MGTIFLSMLIGCQKSTEVEQVFTFPKAPYPPEEAIENGDVVNLHGEISNLQKLNDFVEHVKTGSEDEILITSYTVEGDPILDYLKYDGHQIQYAHDNSQDAFGGSDTGVSSTTCSSIQLKEREDRLEYNLSDCASDVGQNFYFAVPK